MHPQSISNESSSRARVRARDINVLIACEESQAECAAFRELGFTAYSCDIQPVRPTGNPYWHIQGDVRPLLHGDTAFVTQAGYMRCVPRWHLIIAHPPCTYLCRVSSVWMVRKGEIDPERYANMLKAREFFYECLGADAPFVAVENPIPMKRAELPRPTCFAEPSWFGVKYSKKTLYWTKNLPPLMAGLTHPNPKEFVHCSRGKYRSRTFPEMAKAIADQWGNYVLQHI